MNKFNSVKGSADRGAKVDKSKLPYWSDENVTRRKKVREENAKLVEIFGVDKDNPHNWTEDFDHENGKYENKCTRCNSLFIGYRGRWVCKVCYRKQQKIK